VRALIVPSYVMTSLVAAGAFVLGALAAWYETAVLLGAPPAGRTLAAIVLTCLFLAFAVAVTAAAAYLVRGVLATAGVTIVLLLSAGAAGQHPRCRSVAADHAPRRAAGAGGWRALVLVPLGRAGDGPRHRGSPAGRQSA
jgi:hypothetical protein